MCGILGRFSWKGPLDPEAILPRLVNHLAHRGPDDGAFWQDDRFFLGHRRLAIIDLAGGGQPMGTSDGALVVTFNGEIYNYRALRDELQSLGHVFQGNSDTEALLHGYRQWGVDLPKHLIGMFAFAIADRREGTLFLARDPFGEKPLLYVEGPSSVTFASELRPLSAIPRGRPELDESALAAYLCLNYVPGDQTLLRGVFRVPPGTWRLYSSNAVRTGTYWTPPQPSERRNVALSTALEELQDHLDHAVRLALVSDVPVGIFLSGGIDSSLVAWSACRQGRLTRAYCLDFQDDGYSEWPKARLVAERLGLPLTRIPLSTDAASDFLTIVEHADDPLADSSALAVWTVAREAAREHKVVLGGDGGDELFGGYLTYKATLLHTLAVAPLPKLFRRLAASIAERLPTSEGKVSLSYQLMRFLRASTLSSGQAHFTWNGTWLPARAEQFLRKGPSRAGARSALARMAERHFGTGPLTLSALQRADIGDYLPNDILTKVDRMSMAHGLEVRAPFLQPAMAEFALSLPTRYRCDLTGKPKRILRELARRVFGPEIAGSRKQGFSIPIHMWLRGPGRALVADYLSPASIGAIEALDPAEIQRVVTEHMTGQRSYGWELWGLMVLSAWHRARVLDPPKPLSYPSELIQRSIPLEAGAGA
jgi:asparagine synthase (glutamine-hydrolysing)